MVVRDHRHVAAPGGRRLVRFSRVALGSGQRLLVGLVLIFNVYVIYQQLQISCIRRQLTDQVFAVDKVETLAQEVYRMALLDPLRSPTSLLCSTSASKIGWPSVSDRVSTTCTKCSLPYSRNCSVFFLPADTVALKRSVE